jgi:hypothetical protein
MGSLRNRLSRLEKRIRVDDSESPANQANALPILDTVAELRWIMKEANARNARGEPPPRQTREHRRLTEELRLHLEECRKNLVAPESQSEPLD